MRPTRLMACAVGVTGLLVVTAMPALGQGFRPKPGPAPDERPPAKQTDKDGDRVPDRVGHAVHRRYPDSKLILQGTTEISGVKVYQIKVETDHGDVKAAVTEDGDLIDLGYPGVNARNMPETVKNVTDALFGREPQSVQKLEGTTYFVELAVGRRSYRVEIDPVGRVRDIQGAAELRADDPATYERAAGDDVEAIRPRLERFFEGARIKSAWRHPEGPGFFVVDLTTRDQDVRVLVAEREVSSYRVTIDAARLPGPVSQTLHDYFQNAKVREVQRSETVYYRVVQSGRGGDEMVVLVSPTGNVIRVREAERNSFKQLEPGRPIKGAL